MTSTPQDIQHSLEAASRQLIQAGLVDSPKLDAELLLAHALEANRTYLYTWSDKHLTDAQLTAFHRLLSQRLSGHPIAHILGEREFWGLSLKVTADTLIPRPDTETLVETALELQTEDNQVWSFLDLGTGTGAIGLALKSELPNSQVTAIDYSTAALEVARQNAKTHNLEIRFLQSDWFSALSEQANPPLYHCIVSNPPYIEESDPHILEGDVRFEPLSALTSGADGLEDIRTITQQAWQYLAPNGWLLIEHGYHQAEDVAEIFKANHYQSIRLVKDLGGNPRVTLGQKQT
ncbi:MAG: peptide chain release factor N(5)-glutamine methyltransferase [Gammaproteobacteria bacterium]|nr:peptide chain release factor N(5)-glutamine methyltransferase [Gammaproteobacteria bacterium]